MRGTTVVLSSRCSTCLGVDAHKFSWPALLFKLHEPFYQSNQGVILTPTDILAGFPTSTALTGQDVAAEHMLATKFLDSQPLRMRVPPVPRRTYPFFMSHLLFPICDCRFAIFESSQRPQSKIQNPKSKIASLCDR